MLSELGHSGREIRTVDYCPSSEKVSRMSRLKPFLKVLHLLKAEECHSGGNGAA